MLMVDCTPFLYWFLTSHTRIYWANLLGVYYLLKIVDWAQQAHTRCSSMRPRFSSCYSPSYYIVFYMLIMLILGLIEFTC